jgi:hypothetical protein
MKLKCLLTPTQKAKLTGTFFIRTQFWTPTGSRVEFELPWVSIQDGEELFAKITAICGQKMHQTNEQWEDVALKAQTEIAAAKKTTRAK